MDPARRRRGPALALIGAIIVLAIVAVMLTSGAAPHSRVTPAAALQVVRAYDRAETLATLQLSIPAQDAVETAPESIIDDAAFAALHAQGQRRSAPQPQSDVHIQIYVPVQHRGVESFAAYVSSRVQGRRGAILMVFRRDGPHRVWRQSLSPAFPGAGTAPPVAIGPGGYARRLDGAAQARALRLSAATVAADYAGLLELAVRGDRLQGGDPFAPGAFTSRLAASDRQTVQQLAATGATAGGTALPAPYPELTLALRGGGALVLFTVAARQAFTAPPGGSLQQAASRSPWTPLVAPGSYRSIATTSLMTVAALVPPAGSSRRVDVIAETASVIAVKAVPLGAATIA